MASDLEDQEQAVNSAAATEGQPTEKPAERAGGESEGREGLEEASGNSGCGQVRRRPRLRSEISGAASGKAGCGPHSIASEGRGNGRPTGETVRRASAERVGANRSRQAETPAGGPSLLVKGRPATRTAPQRRFRHTGDRPGAEPARRQARRRNRRTRLDRVIRSKRASSQAVFSGAGVTQWQHGRARPTQWNYHARSGGAQGHEHPEAQPDRQGSGRHRRRRPAQAGADLQDPADAGRKERPDLLRRRARMPARRLRLPARARVQLSARPRRRLRFALADPPLRSAHRRHHLRPDPPAQGRRALLRAHQGRRDQLRAARGSAQQDLLRQPDAALSQTSGSSSKPRATTSPAA